jgi:SAM-dependent methyltransferase
MGRQFRNLIKYLLRLAGRKDPFWKYGIKKRLLKMFFPGTKSRDDFDWRIYTDHYTKELQVISKNHSLSIAKGDYTFNGKVLEKRANILDLHPNYRLVYETILQLSPASVLEVGCGRGDHLHNLSILEGKLDLYGVDISRKQIDYLCRSYPELKTKVQIFDIARSYTRLPLKPMDAVFTQAVLMHIQDASRYEMSLRNIFAIARLFVVLMENWVRHDFLEDIQQLHLRHRIPWDNIFYHYRVSSDLDRQHLMVISRTRLKYPILNDYSILVNSADNTV